MARTRLASEVRADKRLRVACQYCVSGDQADCTRVNAICGSVPGVCRIDATGRLELFLASASARRDGK